MCVAYLSLNVDPRSQTLKLTPDTPTSSRSELLWRDGSGQSAAGVLLMSSEIEDSIAEGL